MLETLDHPDAEVEGPEIGSDEGPEEGALLTLGLLEGDEDACAETLRNLDGEVEGPVDGSNEEGEGAALLNNNVQEGDEEGCTETFATQTARAKSW